MAEHTPIPWRVGRPLFRCIIQHNADGRPGGHGTKDCRYTFGYWSGEDSISRDREYTPTDVSTVDDGLVAGMWDHEEGGIRRPEDAAFIVQAVNAHQALVDALELMYDKWEDGDPCFENPEDHEGSLGNAFKLSFEEENQILAALALAKAKPTKEER